MRKILGFVFSVLLSLCTFAQVTTSSISGNVTSSDGKALDGATVKAIHVNSGTSYTTVSGKDGAFFIPNMIPGGPYTLTISYTNYQNYSVSDVNLPLGENTKVDPSLALITNELTSVLVTAPGVNSRRKTGASTNIGKALIEGLPTLSRSLSDITRLTPQANGNSFGGTNNRFNNITIDGAVNNDVFGLSGSGSPGGQANTTPISLDAIQEVQVVIAPYDITYGNFTGGGVNAITRSGTNNYEGSVYLFSRNEKTIGDDPVSKVKSANFKNNQYGFRLGGPIVKDKLFFFVNAELSRINQPTIFNAGETNSLLTVKEAQDLSDTLSRRYGYDAGSFNAFDAQTQSNKIFGRVDWNITEKHRLTVRHNYISAYDDNISRSPTLFRFGNNAYRFNNKQNITVAELRSRFSNRISNNLIVGLHRIRDFRTTYGDLFPFIEISKGAANNGIQVGAERSSVANELDQDIFEVTDNVKIFRGKHTFTVGTHNEFYKFRNLFINNFNGRWTFASLSSFYANNPRQVQVQYSNVAGDPKPSAEFDAAQLGFYVQDEYQVTSNLRLTGGVRVDVPIIGNDPAYNKVVDSTYKGKYSTSNTPSGQLLWSPRLGFNWDVLSDRKFIVRGGAGIFSGRSPFVWISNQFSNNGLLLSTINVTDNATTPANEVNAGKGFESDPAKQSTVGSAGRTFEVNLIDKDFKLPQVARFNLATDIKLPWGLNATLEGIYSKTINNVLYQDINLAAPTGVVDPVYNNGADKRIAYSGSTNAGGRRINPNITNAILLTNTDEGYTYNLTALVNKTIKNGFFQVAYNYSNAKDLNSGASSTALSNWEFVQVVGNPNDPKLATSNYQLTHRITAVASYGVTYAKHFKTSLALFYNGNSGQVYTFLVNGDLNSDGRFGNDLLYVPLNSSEIKFVDLLNSDNTVRATAAAQATAFNQFINNDEYLSSRRGQYVERNKNHTPWENVVDARLTQDFMIRTGKIKHALQFTFDVFNLTNLLNNDWGKQYVVGNQASSILSTVNRTTGNFIGKGYNFTPNTVPYNLTFGSRWQGQFGIRYLFN
ncbi:MAG: TonB-dependent receptor [Bacteroidota bacterium]